MSPTERILDALVQLVAEQGIEAVSVRSVATAAGVSPALVQYHFGTKHRLMAAAFAHVHQRMGERLNQVESQGSTLELLRRYLLAWFPLDAERRSDAIVWLAFTASAATDPELAAEARQTDASLVSALTTLIERGVADGTIRAEVQPAAAAALLLAIVDGLTLRAITDPDPNSLVPLLDAALDRLLTPEGSIA